MLWFVWGVTFGTAALTIVESAAITHYKGREGERGRDSDDYPSSTQTAVGIAWTVTFISLASSVIASVVYLIMWKTGNL